MSMGSGTSDRSHKGLWLGGGIAAALALAAYVGFQNPPAPEDAVGTIAEAKRYRGEKIDSADVQLGDQTIQELVQTDEFASLIQDEDFVKLMADGRFAELMADGRLAQLMADGRFVELMADGRYAALMVDGRLAQLAADGRYAELMADSRYAEIGRAHV